MTVLRHEIVNLTVCFLRINIQFVHKTKGFLSRLSNSLVFKSPEERIFKYSVVIIGQWSFRFTSVDRGEFSRLVCSFRSPKAGFPKLICCFCGDLFEISKMVAGTFKCYCIRT